MHKHARTHVYMCVRLCLCVYVSVCLRVCVSVRLCLFAYMYVYMYIYTCIYLVPSDGDHRPSFLLFLLLILSFLLLHFRAVSEEGILHLHQCGLCIYAYRERESARTHTWAQERERATGGGERETDTHKHKHILFGILCCVVENWDIIYCTLHTYIHSYTL